MDVTTTPLQNLTLSKITADFPILDFIKNTNGDFRRQKNTIFYDDSEPNVEAFLLHEISHATLNHQKYKRDIQLLTIEREAWDNALLLAKKYNVIIDEELIEDAMDSYREWIHKRSICPSCRQNGIEISKKVYKCYICYQEWTPNEAKTCRIYRKTK